jgi:hypothetical protein
VQRTGVSSRSASPSTPTGIWEASAPSATVLRASWRNPATSSRISTAAAAVTKAKRASQRWATVAPPGASTLVVAIPDHRPRLVPFLMAT